MTDANVVLGYIPEGRSPTAAIEISRDRVRRGCARRGSASTGARRPRPRERGDDARAARGLDREGPRPGRLRRWSPTAARARCTPRRSRPSSACGRRSCRRSPASSRRPGCCSRAPSATTSASAASTRASPTSTSCAGSTPRCAAPARATWRRVADVRYRGQSWSMPIDFPGEIDAAGGRRARRAVRGRARAALRHAARGGLAGRHPRAAARRARAGAAEPFALLGSRARRGRRHAPRRLRRTGRSRRPSARATRSPSPRPGPLLVDEYDTTVVVPPGWTVRLDARAARSCSTTSRSRSTTAAPRRRDRGADRRQRARDRSPTRWRRRSSAPRTRPSCATRWTSRPRSARRSGETVAQAVTIPLQLGSIPNAMQTLLERFGDSFAPGDVYLVNDPFDGASHTPDIFVVKPSFAGDDADRLRGDGRAPRRRRRPRARDDAPATAPRSSRRGCACRGCGSYDRGEPVEARVRDHPRERAHAARAARRPRGAGRRVPHRRSRPAGARRRTATSGSATLMDGLLDHTERLLRARDRELARRHRRVHRLHRLGRDRRLRRADHRRLTVRGDELIADFSRLGADGARLAQLHAVVRRGEPSTTR